KQRAMAYFASQLQRQDYAQQITALNRYRTYTLSASVTAAEAYLVVSAEELVRDPLKFHWSEEERRIAEAADRAIRRAVSDMRTSVSGRIPAPLRAGGAALRKFLDSGPPAVTRPLRASLRAARTVATRVLADR